MPSQELVKSKSATTYKCHIQVVDDLLDIINGLQIIKWKLAMDDHDLTKVYLLLIIYLGAYELIELDKYAMLLAMRCLNG